MTFAVNLLIESGDLVVSNWTVKGTHTGAAFYDVPPSGDPLEINGTAILRLRERPDRRAVGWTALPAWAGIDPLNHDSERSRTYRSRAAMFRTARSRCGRPRSPSWP